MLETIAEDGYMAWSLAGNGVEEDSGNALSARRLTEEKVLRASDAQAGDAFGISVAISEEVAIVGAWREDGGGGDPLPNTGAAYVFESIEGFGWLAIKKLIASDAQVGDSFGRSVAVSGDILIVGALFEDGGAGDSLGDAGAAYVFGRDQGGVNNWGEAAKLSAPDAQAGDQFGRSVAISGDTAIVGAVFEDGGGGDPLPDTGAAYVFESIEGFGWLAIKKLTASDAQASDGFGISVAISGDTVIVGANAEDGDGSDVGAAYVFERNQGGANNWGEVAKLTASDAQTFDSFGISVAISGDTAIVGAWGEDGGAGNPLNNPGAAYVFGRDQGGVNNWGEVTKLIASDAQASDEFGFSVAISGDTAIVGAHLEDGGAGDPFGDAGAAYVFGRDQGGVNNWGEVTKLTASDAQADDFFGFSVAISGDTAIVGAHLEDGGAGDPLPETGAAYVFRESFLRFFIGGLLSDPRVGPGPINPR